MQQVVHTASGKLSGWGWKADVAGWVGLRLAPTTPLSTLHPASNQVWGSGYRLRLTAVEVVGVVEVVEAVEVSEVVEAVGRSYGAFE